MEWEFFFEAIYVEKYTYNPINVVGNFGLRKLTIVLEASDVHHVIS